MTNESAERIRHSYMLLLPDIQRVTQSIYERVFTARPDVRQLFQGDMSLQQQHLAAALALIVRNLPMLDALESSLKQLGADHARAGVRPEHYPLVRDVLLASMADALAAHDVWSEPLADDWRQLIDQIAAYMLQGGLSVARGLDVRW